MRNGESSFEKGMFIISIDVDVGNKELGTLNQGKNDRNVNDNISEYEIGRMEEAALPFLVDVFRRYETPVSFAVRGQVIELKYSVLDLLLDSSVKHDIGGHGYYHSDFTVFSRKEAENELGLISSGFRKKGLVPRTFIYPKNRVAHLDLLSDFGYKCFRGSGNIFEDRMCIEKQGNLVDVHPSAFLGQNFTTIFVKRMLDIAEVKRLPLHVWFHPWNFGADKSSIEKNVEKILAPILSYARKKVDNDLLSIETMLSASEKLEKVHK